MPKKHIHKKSLAVALIKRGHNFLYSTRNHENDKYHVFTFAETPELIKDMLAISTQQRTTQQLNMQVGRFA
jgi:hypothetical protein